MFMSATTGRKTIMVIDDEPHVLLLVQGILKLHGFAVVTAQNGRQAINLLREAHDLEIDLMVVDLALPDLNGHEVVRRIHEFRPGVPCLYLSGLFPQDVPEPPDCNVQHIAKPFKPPELVRKIHQMLAA